MLGAQYSNKESYLPTDSMRAADVVMYESGEPFGQMREISVPRIVWL